MKLPLRSFFHHDTGTGKAPANFPVGASFDYSAIKEISEAEIAKMPRVSLQMLMDYCLSKEIFEVAALIRDNAAAKGFRLRTS